MVISFTKEIFKLFQELKPVHDLNDVLKKGEVWELKGGMHLPDPFKNSCRNVERWYCTGVHKNESFELQLDKGEFYIRNLYRYHAVLFIRYNSLHHGPKNQATLMLRSSNHSDDGMYYIQFGGKIIRRNSISNGIDAAINNGLQVKRDASRIYIGLIADHSFRNKFLDTSYIAAQSLCQNILSDLAK